MVQIGMAILSLTGRRDSPAELVSHRLHSVADAKQGKTRRVDPLRGQRRTRFIDAGRPTGKHHALGIERLDGLPGAECGISSQYTPHSLIRRAISREYWEPKSMMTTVSLDETPSVDV